MAALAPNVNTASAEAIQAEAKDGVLKVRIPKTKIESPRKIAIEVK